MSVDDLLAEIRDDERRFVVYGGDETALETAFGSHDIQTVQRPLPPEVPEPFVVIEDGGTFAGAIALSELENLLAPPIARPGEREDVSPGYRVLFDALAESVFTAMDRQQLLAVSREIEDRAFRVGSGTLRASFQRLSKFESQLDVYRTLAIETDLDIHVHGRDDWDPPAIQGITYHRDTDGDLAEYWVLAFESDQQACGLVAAETDDGYRGFWTDDPARLQTTLSELGLC